MSCEIINHLQSFQKDKEYPQSYLHGILDVHCGCMVSKWTSIEFKRIFAVDKDYLQMDVVYMEPFDAFDSVSLHLEWENIPPYVLKAYIHAKSLTTFEEAGDGMKTMIVPYIHKNAKTFLKRVNSNIMRVGEIIDIDSALIAHDSGKRKIDSIFRNMKYVI